jgi:hypothetical protein
MCLAEKKEANPFSRGTYDQYRRWIGMYPDHFIRIGTTDCHVNKAYGRGSYTTHGGRSFSLSGLYLTLSLTPIRAIYWLVVKRDA